MRLAAFLVFCMLCVYISGIAGFVASAAANTEQKPAQLEAKEAALARLTAQERAIHKDLADAADEIAALEERIAAAEKKLQAGLREEQRLRKQLQTLDAQYVAAQQDLQGLLQGLWPVHVQHVAHVGRHLDSWHEADRQFTWLAGVYGAAEQGLERLEAIKVPLMQGVESHQLVLEDAREALTALNGQKNELVSKKIDFDSRLAAVRKEKRTTEQELQTILAAIQSVKITMERKLTTPKVAIQAPSVQQNATAAVKQEPPAKPDKAPEAPKAPQRLQVPAALADLGMDKLKGRLPWPVLGGKVVKTFTPNASPPVRGVAFSVPEQAGVHAVAAGKVVHVDTLRGFGRVVILLHGDDYYTLYAYLSQSLVTTGQELAMGDALGISGFYPDLKGPGLYFELRFHQKAINPKTWLAAR